MNGTHVRLGSRSKHAFLILGALCALAIASIGVAQRLASNHQPVNPQIAPAFRDYKDVVGRYLAAKHAHGTNHICITGMQEGDGDVAWVLWPEGERIILWEGGLDDLTLSRRQLSTKSDVVGSDAELHGSTYLMTAAWVRDLRQTCASKGISFLVRI